MTAARNAELFAELEKLTGLKPKPVALPKPQVVVERGEVVRDAEVAVSRSDPNAANANGAGIVQVQRVRINMAAAERQFAEREAAAEARVARDPYRLGLWD